MKQTFIKNNFVVLLIDELKIYQKINATGNFRVKAKNRPKELV